jgi:adenosylmethionine-8-amino-7-oxononanoate aminotransferase
MVNERVFQALAQESHTIGTFGHGFTYSGHPVPAAVAIETLKIYDEMDIGAHVGSVGPHMQAELRRRFADHPLVGEVRGVGLIAAVELVADKARGGERYAVLQPAADHHQGGDRRHAGPPVQGARRTDRATAPRTDRCRKLTDILVSETDKKENDR